MKEIAEVLSGKYWDSLGYDEQKIATILITTGHLKLEGLAHGGVLKLIK